MFNIIGGVHFDMWDSVVTRQNWALAFFAFPVEVETEIDLGTRRCKYKVFGCSGGWKGQRNGGSFSLGLHLCCCRGSNAGVLE